MFLYFGVIEEVEYYFHNFNVNGSVQRNNIVVYNSN
jgi:hypothetical protein